jgi:hypothetical protein
MNKVWIVSEKIVALSTEVGTTNNDEINLF